MVVLTDEPADFADLPVRAIRHRPVGHMATYYEKRPSSIGSKRGAAAYHDKRFVLRAVLQDYDSALFLDADTRVTGDPKLDVLPSGLAVTTAVRESVAQHLEKFGAWRKAAFHDLACELTGNADCLLTAQWCQEACFAVTKDGNEERFFAAWDRAVAFLEAREVFSGEGGVIGLAAAYAGWTVNYAALAPFYALIKHEGGGPKSESQNHKTSRPRPCP
jgi:hypothetical protein